VIEPHPPIARMLDEVKSKLQSSGVDVVEMDISPLFSQCQSLANALFGVEGGNNIFDLLESFQESLSPWLATRLKRKPAMDLLKARDLHGKREELRTKFLEIWKDKHGDIAAFVCPIAPHPVPPIDRYNGVSYTSSFVLLDYPAGVVPVRSFTKGDMEGEMEEKELGNWDKINRKMCKFLHSGARREDTDEFSGTNFDRSVYVGTPLCVQVVAPKLEEEKLVQAMQVVDDAIKGNAVGRAGAKL
jgi:amidase